MYIRNILFLSILMIILSASVVSAADTNNTTVINTSDLYDTSLINVNQQLEDSYIDNAIENCSSSSAAMDSSTNDHNFATIENLQKEIDNTPDGSILTLNRDYNNLNGSTVFLNKDITIVGNNHTIYCNGFGDSYVLDVESKATITNLNFDGVSKNPIYWKGNDGLVAGCTFSGSGISPDTKCPDTGGAISWTGNNGAIYDCKFIDTTAMLGGALFVKGSNITVLNSTFNNCCSKMLGESIYLAPNCRSSNIKSKFTNNKGIAIIDASSTTVSEYGLTYPHNINFMNNKLDGVKLLYNALIFGHNKIEEENIMYYGLPGNNNTYQLSIIKNLADGCSYQKDIFFSNVTHSNDIFNELVNNKFITSQRFMRTVDVNSPKDYQNAHAIKGEVFNKYIELLNSDDKSKVIKALNVKFNDKLSINSAATWNNEKGFDVINIEGHGSKIYCNSGDRDEHKFLHMKDYLTISISNLTVYGFNSAVENLEGTLILNKVTFDHNRKNYIIDRDYGAAIVNAGNTFIDNCTFSNNYCKYGGAIFNQGNLNINNSIFTNNHSYGNKGHNICNAQNGVIVIDGQDCSKGGDLVDYAKSLSATKIRGLIYMSLGVSALAGVASGVVSGIASLNPVIGIAVGTGVGVAVGAATAAYIVNNVYDVKYDRVAAVACIVTQNAVIGFLGASIGSAGNAAASFSSFTGPVNLVSSAAIIPCKIWDENIAVQLGIKNNKSELAEGMNKVNDLLQKIHDFGIL